MSRETRIVDSRHDHVLCSGLDCFCLNPRFCIYLHEEVCITTEHVGSTRTVKTIHVHSNALTEPELTDGNKISSKTHNPRRNAKKIQTINKCSEMSKTTEQCGTC